MFSKLDMPISALQQCLLIYMHQKGIKEKREIKVILFFFLLFKKKKEKIKLSWCGVVGYLQMMLTVSKI